MVEIAPDQWIGKITAKELMRLKDSQVIKYNENTQRTLKRIVRGENRYYKIALNEKSVKEIKAALAQRSYISDDITLNMPVETTEFEYVNGSIVIKELDKLDIIDGYTEIITTLREGTVSCRPNDRFATALVLEGNLGLRISDILNLRLCDIVRDGDRYRLDINEQKTGKQRSFTVPLSMDI